MKLQGKNLNGEYSVELMRKVVAGRAKKISYRDLDKSIKGLKFNNGMTSYRIFQAAKKAKIKA